MSLMPGSHSWYLSHEEVKNRDSTIWLTFSNPASQQYLQMHLQAERFIFLGLMIEVF